MCRSSETFLVASPRGWGLLHSANCPRGERLPKRYVPKEVPRKPPFAPRGVRFGNAPRSKGRFLYKRKVYILRFAPPRGEGVRLFGYSRSRGTVLRHSSMASVSGRAGMADPVVSRTWVS